MHRQAPKKYIFAIFAHLLSISTIEGYYIPEVWQLSTVADRLKFLRNKIGKTQKEVAELTGLVRATLANWEIGRAEPDLESVKLLADFYGVSVNNLVGAKEVNTPNFEAVWQEKNLGDAVVRIVNICAEFNLPKSIRSEMIDKAIEKYGIPGGEGSIAAHGPAYPGSGALGGEDPR